MSAGLIRVNIEPVYHVCFIDQGYYKVSVSCLLG